MKHAPEPFVKLLTMVRLCFLPYTTDRFSFQR